LTHSDLTRGTENERAESMSLAEIPEEAVRSSGAASGARGASKAKRGEKVNLERWTGMRPGNDDGRMKDIN